MNIQDIISVVQLGVISGVAAWVAIYWHIATKGTWRDWPAGQSLMGLLSIIAVGFGFGVINRFLGSYPAKTTIMLILYTLFVTAIIWIGLTVRKEMRRGKAKQRDKHPTHSGPVSVIVASTNEEEPHDD